MEPKGSATHTAIGRLAFLDGVRAVAALVVVFQHTFEMLFPAFRQMTGTVFSFGQAGVTAFFLVSGFIIPFSLERVNDFKKFWIGRFFRLFPLYWSSLLVATVFLLTIHANKDPGQDGNFVRSLPTSFLINMTMLQRYFGAPNAVGAYWTLGVELTFYALCSLLFLIKLNRHTFWVLLCFSAYFYFQIFRHHGPGIYFGSRMMTMGTFFAGTLLYRYWSGATTLRTALLGLAIFVGPAVLYPFVSLLRGAHSPDPMTFAVLSGTIGGYLVFSAFFLRRETVFPAWLTKAGEISYSIYLMHATLLLLAIVFHGRIGSILTLILTIPVSMLTYHKIEAPAMKFGRALMKRGSAPLEAKPAEAA